MPYDSANVLGKGSSSTIIVKRIYLIGQEVKGNTCRHFEVMGEDIDLTFHTQVVVKGIAVKVAELRGILLQSGASKGYGNIGFNKDRSLEPLPGSEDSG